MPNSWHAGGWLSYSHPGLFGCIEVGTDGEDLKALSEYDPDVLWCPSEVRPAHQDE